MHVYALAVRDTLGAVLDSVYSVVILVPLLPPGTVKHGRCSKLAIQHSTLGRGDLQGRAVRERHPSYANLKFHMLVFTKGLEHGRYGEKGTGVAAGTVHIIHRNLR